VAGCFSPVPGRTVDYFILVENTGEVAASEVIVQEFLNPEQVASLTLDLYGRWWRQRDLATADRLDAPDELLITKTPILVTNEA
jgi:hypothetical protein